MITQNGQWMPDYPGQYPAQDPAYLNYLRQQNHVQQPGFQQQPQQTMTPPTIHAELVMVDSEAVANDYPVAAGASQMMMRKDEAAIYIKTAMQNGYQMDVFEKRPPAPPAPKLDPADVVTKEYLEQRLAALVAHAPDKEAAA